MKGLPKHDHIKIGILGQQGVGKTHILHQYLQKRPPDNPSSTIAVEFATTIFKLRDGTKIKLQLWDTAGNQKYRQILTVHMFNADGIILVYDITTGFYQIQKLLIKIRKQCPQNISIMILGNKIDLVNQDSKKRKVLKNVAEDFANTHNILFFQVSAFQHDVLDWAIQQLVQQIILRKSVEKIQQNPNSKNQLAPNQAYCETCLLF